MSIKVYHMSNGNVVIAQEQQMNDKEVWVENAFLINYGMMPARMTRIPRDLILVVEDDVDDEIIEDYYEKLRNKNLLLG